MQLNAILIIGWSIYDKYPEEKQKELALVKGYRTDYIFECYVYEKCEGGTKILTVVIDVSKIRWNDWNSSVLK